MSMMENDAKDFLLRVVRTLTSALLWLIVNVFIGIYMGWMFFYSKPTAGNYIFYIWMLGSLIALVFYFRKLWSRPLISENNTDADDQ